MVFNFVLRKTFSTISLMRVLSPALLGAVFASATACSGSSGSTPTSIQLGLDADLGGFRLFSASDPWNQDISQMPVDPNSATYVNSMGATATSHADFGTVWNGAPNGMPYVVVSGTQSLVPVSFTYSSESDPGPYPVPADAPIEGGTSSTGDRHVIVIDRDHLKLYEMDNSSPNGSGWKADSGAVFDLVNGTTRPAGWTSADAAGLPIFPGLVRYDEVMIHGQINHALRFTASSTQNGYVAPARHSAGSVNPALPPMGLRVRLKAGYDISWATPTVRIILTALKKYGMILADNGASWAISGSPDPRWNDGDLHDLVSLPGNAFEVVQMGPITLQ